MDEIRASYVNETVCFLDMSLGAESELYNYFSMMIPNYHVIRARNMKRYWGWDGRIRFYNKRTHQLPYGLLPRLAAFAKDYGYQLTVDQKIQNNINKISDDEIQEYVDELNLTLKLRDYQFESLSKSLVAKKKLIISSTGSGKSLPICIFMKWVHDKTDGKVLCIVPTKALVLQMQDDYHAYGLKEKTHGIMEGASRESDARLYVSTWQSMQKMPDEYFKQFTGLIIDEIHQSSREGKDVKRIVDIANKCINAEYRLGTTGTLKFEQIHQIQAEAVTGKYFKATTSKDLIDRGLLSKFQVKMIKIEYPREVSLPVNKLEYDKQLQFVESKENPRNDMIISLATQLKQNTLILFRKIDHGKHLYEKILATGKTTFYIDGQVMATDRKDIVKQMEELGECVLCASYGTFSTGINLKNLHNIIFASSSKSEIRVLQSIGRSLRTHKSKDVATLYDFVDGIKYFKRHAEKRIELYLAERHPFDSFEINIKEAKAFGFPKEIIEKRIIK